MPERTSPAPKVAPNAPSATSLMTALVAAEGVPLAMAPATRGTAAVTASATAASAQNPFEGIDRPCAVDIPSAPAVPDKSDAATPVAMKVHVARIERRLNRPIPANDTRP